MLFSGFTAAADHNAGTRSGTHRPCLPSRPGNPAGVSERSLSEGNCQLCKCCLHSSVSKPLSPEAVEQTWTFRLSSLRRFRLNYGRFVPRNRAAVSDKPTRALVSVAKRGGLQEHSPLRLRRECGAQRHGGGVSGWHATAAVVLPSFSSNPRRGGLWPRLPFLSNFVLRGALVLTFAAEPGREAAARTRRRLRRSVTPSDLGRETPSTSKYEVIVSCRESFAVFQRSSGGKL